MAKIPFGILGAGHRFYRSRNRQDLERQATISAKRSPAKTDKNPTPGQLNQRNKFGFVSKFMIYATVTNRWVFQAAATPPTAYIPGS